MLFTVPLEENKKFDSEGADYPLRKSKSEILREELFCLYYPLKKIKCVYCEVSDVLFTIPLEIKKKERKKEREKRKERKRDW